MVDAASGTGGESCVRGSKMGEDRSSSLRRRLEAHFGVLAAACAVVGLGAATEADAGIVYSGPVNINIPATTAGVYLNVVTGVSNVAPASAPGWDVNPWSATAMSYFNPAAPTGGVYVQRTGGGATANLPAGTLIDATNTFGNATAATTGAQAHVLNGVNIIGFRFQNEANGNATHYAWMRISLSASLFSQPRTIVEYAYEDQAGVGIPAGATSSAPAGVCCRGATCSTTVTTAVACSGSLIGGQTAGSSFPAGAACNSGGSTTTPCCYSDYNKVGGITVNDIFDFLNDWFAGSPYANTGGTGAAGPLAVQNIFDFLNNWFAGGC